MCGGRDFHDVAHLERALDALHHERQFGILTHGGARGADLLSGVWAMKNLLPVCVFPANWEHMGNAAGPLRNKAMLDWSRPDLVVAFPGGRGTADMVNKAMAAKIEIVRA